MHTQARTRTAINLPSTHSEDIKTLVKNTYKPHIITTVQTASAVLRGIG